MALVQKDLWSDILWGTTDCVSPLRNYFCETEINELQIAVSANHDVLWLQIPVYYILRLQVFEN